MDLRIKCQTSLVDLQIKTDSCIVTATNSNNNNKEDNTDIIQKSIGILGRWHIWVCFAVFLTKFPIAWSQLNILFLAPPVNFTCANNETDQCWAQCTEHVFDKSVFTETIITQWDLVCERAYLAKLAQTITMLGILFGNMIFGYCSDKFGRRNPLIIAVILQIVSSTCVAFTPWFLLFLVLRFLSSLATGGLIITGFVLIMELVGTKWRTTVGILYQIPFNLGHLSLPLLSYFLRDWHHFQLSISIPTILLISYIWIVPESPRWLLAVGRKEHAIKVMQKAAKLNKLPSEQIEHDVANYVKSSSKIDTLEEPQHQQGYILDLVRTPVMRMYTFCICFNWLVCGLCFFGVAQYIGQLGGDIFLNVTFSALIEIPSTLFSIWMLKAWGRKWSLILANLLSGTCCFLTGVIPAEPAWIISALNFISVFGLMTSLLTIYIYCGELFPTVIRNIGVGAASMCGRVGSMAAPFVVGLVSIQPWLPSLVFGVILLTGALLCFKLPETLNCKLPDTIEEAEAYEKKHREREEEFIESYVQTTMYF